MQGSFSKQIHMPQNKNTTMEFARPEQNDIWDARIRTNQTCDWQNGYIHGRAVSRKCDLQRLKQSTTESWIGKKQVKTILTQTQKRKQYARKNARNAKNDAHDERTVGIQTP